MGEQTATSVDPLALAMAEALAREFSPERIVLFGSRARGGASPDSDVDLLAIVRSVTDRRALAVSMRRALRPFGVPKDVLVLTEDEYESDRSVRGTLAWECAHDGILLHARR